MNIRDRIRAYTHDPQRHLRKEYQQREAILAYARELERIAAEIQGVADELRRAA